MSLTDEIEKHDNSQICYMKKAMFDVYGFL